MNNTGIMDGGYVAVYGKKTANNGDVAAATIDGD